MRELYEAVLAATKTAVKKEKDVGFSDQTIRMIHLSEMLHQTMKSEQGGSAHLFSPDDRETEQ